MNIPSLLGWATVIFFLLALSNPLMKLLKKNKAPLGGLQTFLIKNHKLFGFLATLSMMAHGFLQFNRVGFIQSGALAAGFLLLQGLLGNLVARAKKDQKDPLLIAHKAVGMMLLFAILIHVMTMTT
ncbi:MAG TPA: hypothetical protein DEA52_02640 [Clostridiaceae bacterium]|nr:hypothetical protein [Clostridiaceae bacterium]